MMFVSKYWWLIGIFILFIVIIVLVSKNKKNKIEYYDQVKQNKKLSLKELDFNPTFIKYIIYKEKKWKVYGEIVQGGFKFEPAKLEQKSNKLYTEIQIKDLELEELKRKIAGQPMPDYIIHSFAVKRKQFLKIYFGEKEIIRIFDNEFVRIRTNRIRMNDNLYLLYRDGFIVSYNPRMIEVQADITERLMKDLHINARGQEQRDFSRVRTDYAHDEIMKDKQIEAEKESKKSVSYG